MNVSDTASGATPWSMRTKDILHPTGEDDCIQVPDDDSFVEQVLATDEDK